MTSHSTSDISNEPTDLHRGMEGETYSTTGGTAEAGSGLSNGTIGADTIERPDDKTLGTLIVSVGLALFGIFWMASALNIPNKTGFGSLGPGFLPFWAGMIMTLIAGGLIVGTIRERIAKRANSSIGDLLPGKGQLRVVGTLAALLVYIVLLPVLHFFINTFLLSAAGLALSGEPLKLRLPVFAALISAALFAIFIYWLEIPLPGSRIFG
jgi:putative tricarboxylic transport membrane protein